MKITNALVALLLFTACNNMQMKQEKTNGIGNIKDDVAAGNDEPSEKMAITDIESTIKVIDMMYNTPINLSDSDIKVFEQAGFEMKYISHEQESEYDPSLTNITVGRT